jgi:hypothetical protein
MCPISVLPVRSRWDFCYLFDTLFGMNREKEQRADSSAPLTTNGLVMPSDFPREPFEAIHKKLASSSSGRESLYAQFAGAWNALSYRYLALTQYGDAFAESVTKFGTSPDATRRYEQERDLFGFFSNGFAAFEAYFYALFAIGALLDSSTFLLESPSHQQQVSPSHTIRTYARAFPSDAILAAFETLASDPAYRQCREVRNILTHRTAPGRTFFVSVGGDETPKDQWKLFDITIEQSMTLTRRADVSRLLSEALEAAQKFVDARFV